MKKLLILAMVVIALLCVAPSALAYPPEGACSGTDAVRNNGRHFWSLEYSTRPTCTEPGYNHYTCAYCGQPYQEVASPATGHDWGPWTTVSAPTCTKAGTEQRVCRNDSSHVETQSLPATGHNWGPWQEISAPTCVKDGARKRYCYNDPSHEETETIPATGKHKYGGWVMDEPATCVVQELQRNECTVCGHKLWRYVGELADHVWGPWQTVKEPSPAGPGLERRICQVESSHQEEQEIPYVPKDHVIVSLTAVQTSPEKAVYHLGDEITWTVTLTNGSTVPFGFSDVYYRYTLWDGSYLVDQGNQNTWQWDALPVGFSWSTQCSHTVSQADVDAGQFCIFWNGHAYYDPDSMPNADTSSYPIFLLDDGAYGGVRLKTDDFYYTTAPSGPALHLDVDVTSPVTPVSYAGQQLTFDAIVTNTGTVDLYGGSVSFYREGALIQSASAGDFPMGVPVHQPFSYTVTEQDAEDGKFSLRWQASGYPGANGKGDRVDSNEVSLPVLPEKDPDVAPQLAATVAEGSGAGKQIGDYVEYYVTMTNIGNWPLTFMGYTCKDNGSGDETSEDFGDWKQYYGRVMAPGDSFTATHRTTVSAGDAEAGAVNRVGWGCGTYYRPSKGGYAALISNHVYPSIPLPDAKPGPDPTGDKTPKLKLTGVTTAADPLTYDAFGNTQEISYYLTVANVGKAPCDVSTMRVATPNGYKDKGIGSHLLYPGDSFNWTETYSFHESEQLSSGVLQISFMAISASCQSNELPFEHTALYEGFTDWTIPDDTDPSSVSVIKTCFDPPEDPAGYQQNETVTYTITAFNNTDMTLNGIAFWDAMYGEGAFCTVDSLPPHGTYTASFDHVITAKDVEDQSVDNIASVTWLDPGSNSIIRAWSNPFTVPTTDKSTDEMLGVKINITFLQGPANGSYYVEGEQFDVLVEWQNTSDVTLTDVGVLDAMANRLNLVPGGYLMEHGTLSAHEKGSYSFQYTVTETDADEYQQRVDDLAAIGGVDPNGQRHVALYYIQEQAGKETGIGGMVIVKEETSTPANGSYYELGEDITYTITYTNTGEDPLTDVRLYDTLSADPTVSDFPSITTLHPTDSKSYPFTHTVTAEDVERGYVANTALVVYSTRTLNDAMSKSNTVISPAGRPLGVGEEPIGTITLENTEGATCVLRLDAHGGGVSQYTLTPCAKHGETLRGALTLIEEAGEDKEALASAWKQARQIWLDELEEQYSLLLSGADGIARDAVVNDRMAFLVYLSTQEALLNARYPDQPQIAARQAAEMLMRQVAELCYLAGNAPAQRPDSLISGTYSHLAMDGNGAESCAEILEYGDGAVTITDMLCVDDIANETAVETMLGNVLTRAQYADIFTRAQRIYKAALDANTTARYRAADAGLRPLIAQNRQSFDLLFRLHQDLLKCLYPDQPEIVAEVLSQLWKTCMIDHCGLQ